MIRWHRRGSGFVGAAVLLAACGGSDEPRVAEVRVEPEEALIVGDEGGVRFSARAFDADGWGVTATTEWSVGDTTVAEISDRGFATGRENGTTTVTATVDGVTATARLEVYIPRVITSYEPGKSYFGRRDYVVYVPGELPVILSAAHGGPVKAAEIPDRTYGVTLNDTYSLELTYEMRSAFRRLTGQAPHMVIVRLHRSKLDANRAIEEAAQGNVYAELAWTEFQDWIGTARSIVADDFGGGLYLDIHGHAHDIKRVELGYLLSASRLNRPDTALDSPAVAARSSIRAIAASSSLRFSRLLRGPVSLGGFYEAEDIPVVPGPANPGPGDAAYWSGGYNTLVHGSRGAGEVVSGVQLEHHYPGLRDTEANRRAYAERAARAIREFMLEHYGFFEAEDGGAKGHRGS